jgi:hypothetical protein
MRYCRRCHSARTNWAIKDRNVAALGLDWKRLGKNHHRFLSMIILKTLTCRFEKWIKKT